MALELANWPTISTSIISPNPAWRRVESPEPADRWNPLPRWWSVLAPATRTEIRARGTRSNWLMIETLQLRF